MQLVRFDIIHQSWSKEDYETCNLQIKDGVLFKTNNNVHPAVSGVLNSTKQWFIGLKSSIEKNEIYEISQKIDDIVSNELKVIENEIKESNPLKRITIITKRLDELNRIDKNLKEHDLVINDWNARFIFKEKLVGCAKHTQTENKIRALTEQLQETKKKTVADPKFQKGVEDDIKRQLDHLFQIFDNGIPIDRNNIGVFISAFEESIQHLNSPKKQTHRNKFNAIINLCYTQTLMFRIADWKITVPTYLELLFSQISKIKSNEYDLYDIIKNRRMDFLLLLNKKTEELTDSKDIQAPQKYIDEIQELFLIFATESLSGFEIDQRKRLLEIFKAFHNFELQVAPLFANAQAVAKESFKEILAQTISKPESLQPLCDRAHTTFPAKIYTNIFKELNILTLLRSIFESEEQFKQKLNQALTLLKNNIPDQYTLENEILNQLTGWYQKHGEYILADPDLAPFIKYIVFPYQQSMYGKTAMLDDGVCASISYRFIKAFKKCHLKPINSLEDITSTEVKLTPNSVKQLRDEMDTEFPLVTARDRMIEIAHLLERTCTIPVQILKRDGLREHYNPLFCNFCSFDALLETIEKNSTKWADSSGVFYLACQESDPMGHALVIQVNKENNLFRFFDSNKALFQFTTYQELKEVAQRYVTTFYKFNNFSAIQFPEIS